MNILSGTMIYFSCIKLGLNILWSVIATTAPPDEALVAGTHLVRVETAVLKSHLATNWSSAESFPSTRYFDADKILDPTARSFTTS